MSAATEWQVWRDQRFAGASAPYGTAALDRTEWLVEGEVVSLPGVPGRWSREGQVIRAALAEGDLRLVPGEEAQIGTITLRNFLRDGSTALRVLDPESPNRTTLAGIDAFPYDPAWIVRGALVPAEAEQFVDVEAVDGVVSRSRLVGTVSLITPSGEVQLTLTEGRGGRLTAVIADATSGVETYRFRFLDLAGVDDDGTVEVDFNRAYLPPCAFSSEYVCPLPLPGNRWTVPVLAGETQAVRR